MYCYSRCLAIIHSRLAQWCAWAIGAFLFICFGSQAATNSATPVYATLDPAHAATGLTLSADNLSIVGNSGYHYVRGTIGKSSGKWFWEFPNSGVNTMIGVCNDSADMNSTLYQSANAWFYYGNDGSLWHGPGMQDQPYAAAFGGSNVIRVRLDMDAGVVYFNKDGLGLGQAFSGLSGTIYPCVGYQGLPTANFGQSAFVAPPVGYNLGLFNVGSTPIVNPTAASTTTAITTHTPNPSMVNTPITVTVSLAANTSGPGVPSGAITVSDGAASCVIALPALSCNLTPTTAGAKTLTATYSGDANFNSSTASIAHTVNASSTTTAYATWDPAHAATGLTLSADNLSIVGNSGYHYVRGTIGKSSGKWFWEFPNSGVNTMIGVCNDSADMNSTLYQSANAWFYYGNDGSLWHGPSMQDQPYAAAFSGSDLIRVRLDMDAGVVYFNKNGLGLGQAFSGLSGTIYPCVGYQGLPTANFGQSAFVAPPVGYNLGLFAAGSTPVVNPTIVSTTTAITAHTPNPSTVNAPVSVTVSVAANAQGAGVPSGIITVSDGAASCVIALPGLSCNLTPTTAGAKTLTAAYSGDANFSASATSIAHTVNASASVSSSNVTYATLDPAHAATGLALSANNLSIAGNAGYHYVRGTIGKSSGKWFWEFPNSGTNTMIGVCNDSADMNSTLYQSANAWFYYGNDGSLWHGPSMQDQPYAAAFSGSDLIRVRLDMDAGVVYFNKNGLGLGQAFSGLSGTIYPCVGYQGLPTANFGQSAFVAPPVGYNLGLFDTGSTPIVNPPAPLSNADPVFWKEWGRQVLNAPKAWELVRGSAYIGVIDTGVYCAAGTGIADMPCNIATPALKQNFRAQFSKRISEPPTSGTIIYGVFYPPLKGIVVDNSVAESASDLGPGHGIHVAGIISATDVENKDVKGICPTCSFSALIRSTDPTYLNAFNQADIIKYGVDHGLQVLNMSLGIITDFSDPTTNTYSGLCGGTNPDPQCAAIQYALDHDVVIVAAAGNNYSSIQFPANIPGVVAVGGVQVEGMQSDGAPIASFWRNSYGDPDVFKELAYQPSWNWMYPCILGYPGPECGSAYGGNNSSDPQLTVLAPARDVFSTVYPGQNHNAYVHCGDSYGLGGLLKDPVNDPDPLHDTNNVHTPVEGYGSCTGTSMATPHITGIVGLMRSANPLLDQRTIKTLLSTGSYATPCVGTDADKCGNAGIPDARKLVQAALTSDVVDGTVTAVNTANVINRLTPLFSFYSSSPNDNFYTVVPQMAMAAVTSSSIEVQNVFPTEGGPAIPKNVHKGNLLPQPSSGMVVYAANGSPVPGYSQFVPCLKGPDCGTPSAIASVFTSFINPQDGSELAPLYRYSQCTKTTCSAHHLYTTSQSDEAITSDYLLDGIEGYIYPANMPPPSGSVRLCRNQSNGAYLLATFPISNACSGILLGWVYPVIQSRAVCANDVSCDGGPIQRYQGLWGNSNESGWGVSVTQHGNVIVSALNTYDPAGNPLWYVLSNCTLTGTSCSGPIYLAKGGVAPTIPWNGAGLSRTQVGNGTFSFTDENSGTFSFTINGVAGSKTITRQDVSSSLASGATPSYDYTDLWWNANESGWGIAITQQTGNIFASWYTFDASGKATWYVASNCQPSGNSCTGDLYKVTGGSPLTSPWNGVNTVKVGDLAISFTGYGTATMTGTLDGLPFNREITREPF